MGKWLDGWIAMHKSINLYRYMYRQRNEHVGESRGWWMNKKLKWRMDKERDE